MTSAKKRTGGPRPQDILIGVGMLVAVGIAAFGVYYWGIVPPIVQCGRLAEAASRDDCRLEIVSQDGVAMDEIREVIDVIEDPVSRDVVRLRLIVMDPANADALCPAVEGPRAREWCERIKQRPHLETTAR